MKNIVLIAALLVGAQTILSADENSADSPFSFVYVTQDGGNGAYEAFPDVCRLADGRLLCVFYDGWGAYFSPDPGRQPSRRREERPHHRGLFFG
ncbi:MAG: hypothetical protein IKE64_03790 [Thermoguttaceae bacterium]|nr:hypothetical protein [Thermoguttaceae bacterium]